ncbi:MAG: hypothetical protein NTW05_26735 [Pseudonocardiales bacterium]|nr:hypothetical protein [Pseudonocardiales bacterium]
MSAATVSPVSPVPPVVAGLCDDAAVFPPGSAPLPAAVREHHARRGAWWAALVGPLVLPAAALPRLGPLLPVGTAPLALSVTLPDGPAVLPRVLATAAGLPVVLRAVEVAVPTGTGPAALLDRLGAALEGAPELDVYVEVPRDARRAEVLAALQGRCRAKFRTGGVRADLHPDEAELAAALAAVVAAGVPFKATAGLHHTVRNTDPDTGFEQHGFLNLLLATDALAHGGDEAEAQALLAERDAATVAAAVRALDPGHVERTRAAFTSFGTCSTTDPLTELVDLGIVPARVSA